MRTDHDTSTERHTHLKARRVVFVGVARNCEGHLPGVLDNLARFSALYGEASFLFTVSDSQDSTISILEKWMADGRRGQVVDVGNLERQLPLRTQRLAFVRNACMDRLRDGKESAFDHLVVVDLDDVLAAPMSVDAFAQAAHWLEGAPTRGGVFANGTPRYYDIWALRHDAWCPHDCWHPIWFREPTQNEYRIKAREVFARMIKIPLWLPPVRVLSAFGGIGIYKLCLAKEGRYVGLDERGRETCEHVAFNAAVREAGGQLYIFPPLVTRSPAEHLDQFSHLPRRWRPLMKWQRLLMTLRWWLTAPLR